MRQRAERQSHAARVRAARAAERDAKAYLKNAAKAHAAAQAEEAEDLTREIAERDAAIETVLIRALARPAGLDFPSMHRRFTATAFDNGPWQTTPPRWDTFEPEPLTFFGAMVPGAKGRHARLTAEAKARFDREMERHDAILREGAAALDRHEAEERRRQDEIRDANAAVDRLERDFRDGEYEAVVSCYAELISSSLDGEFDALSAEVGYSPSSRQLVVDLDLPDIDSVSEEAGYKYVKTADRIDAVPRPAAKRKALYAGFIQQVVLKCLDTVFRPGAAAVDVVTINGMLDSVDPATGQQVRPCLVSVKVTGDTFKTLKLNRVQPDQCLRSLKAAVSSAPTELVAVKPLVEIDMVDPRFIETREVLSDLDTRPNLMDLTPGEFENLITNLFAKMGLETRQTQASRDGGVDCVAFDLRPILGGKVVIQAKRYKNTVGVSAVRDLYGTMQNEGANRGVIVTTSGFGKASNDFAKGKPLELIDGGGLLYLLAEHAGIEARIVVPEAWVDRSNSTE